MIKKEFIQIYMKQKNIPIFSQAKREVEDFIEAMKIAFEKDDMLILRDFGTFEIKETKRKTAFNPKTGEAVACTPRKFIKFKVGADLEERINTKKKRKKK